MNQQGFAAGGANDADNRVVSQSTDTANPTQTGAFAMSLQDLVNLLGRDVSVVVEGVKAFRKGLFTVGAEIALVAIGHLAVFMNLTMTAEPTFHSYIEGLEDYLTLSPTSF